MSLEVVEFHARRKPLAVAIIDANRIEYTYLEVYRDLCGLIEKLRLDLPGLGSMQPVAVSHPDRRLHLLLIFALEALGITSLPFQEPIDPGFEQVLGLCGLVLAKRQIDGLARPFFELSDGWFESAFTTSPPTPSIASWRPDAVTIILTTSGSSGEPKAIPLHRSAFEMRERSRLFQYGFSETSVFLLALPPSMFSIALSARATLRCGGTIAFWSDQGSFDVWHRATHATVLPSNLLYLLAKLPVDFVAVGNLQLMSVGAPLATELRERVHARLGAKIDNRYGSNELGAAMVIGADGIGDLQPDVELEVIGENHQTLPDGEPGVIRGRSPSMARRYVDQAQTLRQFHDGWFVTGDYGVVRGFRRLELLGRADEMLNLGGIKIAPERIEATLLEQHLAKDLAVCALEDANGIAVLYLAMRDVTCDAATLAARLQQSLSSNFGEVRIVNVEEIPRAANGKLKRAELKALVRAYLRAHPRH